MVLLVLLFIVIGDFVDAVPAIIIFMPIVNKLTELGDINRYTWAWCLITTLVFGLITPPYGLSLLMASKFVGVEIQQAHAAVAADLCACSSFTIAFMVCFPKVVLWLPKHVLPESVGCFKNPNPDGPQYICPP